MNLKRISLMGMSAGGWIALTYGAAVPERLQSLVLLSSGGFLPIAEQFKLRGMLMVFLPTRFTVDSFMHWAGFTDASERPVLDLMYLGMKDFRMPKETARVAANPLSDDELRAMNVPTLLLMGENEVLYDAPTALARARRLIPHFQGELLPGCSHDMAVSQHRIVDTRILDFLTATRAETQDWTTERLVA